MQRQVDSALVGPILAVGGLVAVAVAGLDGRADLRLSSVGPFAHAGTGIVVAIFAALAATAVGVVVAFLASLPRNRAKDEFQHVLHPLGTKWERRLAVLFAFAVAATPVLMSGWLARRLPATEWLPVPATPAPSAPSVCPASRWPPAKEAGRCGSGRWCYWCSWRAPFFCSSVVRPRRGAAMGVPQTPARQMSRKRAERRSPPPMNAGRALCGCDRAAPRPSDTPTEVLDRAARAGVVRSEAAGLLLEVFSKARFSRHPITEAERTGAPEALDELFADLAIAGVLAVGAAYHMIVRPLVPPDETANSRSTRTP